jgi:hypothetical protein
LVEPFYAAVKLLLVALPFATVLQIHQQHVGYFDTFNISELARRFVLRGDILGAFTLSCFNIMFSAACADVSRAVSYSPGCAVCNPSGGVASFRTQFEAGTFAATRHSSRILSIWASVVKSLPAIRSMVRRPLAASRRRLDAVTDPFGNAILAASASRMGVSRVSPH